MVPPGSIQGRPQPLHGAVHAGHPPPGGGVGGRLRHVLQIQRRPCRFLHTPRTEGSALGNGGVLGPRACVRACAGSLAACARASVRRRRRSSGFMLNMKTGADGDPPPSHHPPKSMRSACPSQICDSRLHRTGMKILRNSTFRNGAKGSHSHTVRLCRGERRARRVCRVKRTCPLIVAFFLFSFLPARYLI